MHQDIKNFSQLMDIDSTDKISIDVINSIDGNPDYTLTVNGKTILPGSHSVSVGLFDNIIIKCEKKSVHGDIQIKRLTINDKIILPRFNHLAKDSTNIITKPGTWSLVIHQPFFTWYHKVSCHGWIA
jgi:hypothetical protein